MVSFSGYTRAGSKFLPQDAQWDFLLPYASTNRSLENFWPFLVYKVHCFLLTVKSFYNIFLKLYRK